MPRYFFEIRVLDGNFDNNPHGTDLLSFEAALSYPERTIKELQHESRFDDPSTWLCVLLLRGCCCDLKPLRTTILSNEISPSRCRKKEP